MVHKDIINTVLKKGRKFYVGDTSIKIVVNKGKQCYSRGYYVYVD